jgi:hypothetical protein
MAGDVLLLQARLIDQVLCSGQIESLNLRGADRGVRFQRRLRNTHNYRLILLYSSHALGGMKPIRWRFILSLAVAFSHQVVSVRGDPC